MIRVLAYGLGPIGVMVARQLASRDGFRIVGAVDVDPAKVGRDISEVAGLTRRLRVKIDPDATSAIRKTRPDVVALCPSSSIRAVMPQIEGVLAESISMIAAALGWRLDRITDDVKPRIANATVASEFLAVDPGFVSGIVQDGVGYRHGTPIITMHMEAYLGAPDPYDEVKVRGVPNLTLRIPGGVPGDIATASIVVNSIPKVLSAKPGLQTMKDLPVPSFYGGR